VADGQGGVFSRAQALAAGYTSSQVKRFVRCGAWATLRRGIYADQATAQCRDSRVRYQLLASAAVIALGDSVASHRTAATLYGFGMGIPALVTVTRPQSAPSRPRLRGIEVHRAELPTAHITRVSGIPATSAARTVTDLARTTPFRRGVAAADAALHAGLTTKADLAAVISACAHWRGIGRARAVTEFADGGAESALESLARVIFAEQGLPPPELQVRIAVGDRVIARVDFCWKQFRTIAEADGLLKYTNAEVLRREKLRQEQLADLGFEVVRITWQQLRDNPAEVAERIRRAFTRGLASQLSSAATILV
jgi:hypothetical protein